MLKLKVVVDRQRDEIRSLTHEIQQKNRDSEANTPECKSLEEDGKDKASNQLFFTKEDVKHIVQERNELKTNLFLVNEELQYYHRELLNGERIPSLLLCGMKSAIRKQKKKIKAKMLGIMESPSSSGDESTWTQTTATDCVDAKTPDSKIKSLFGMWYGKQEAEPGPWEIINVKEINTSEKEDGSADNV